MMYGLKVLTEFHVRPSALDNSWGDELSITQLMPLALSESCRRSSQWGQVSHRGVLASLRHSLGWFSDVAVVTQRALKLWS